MKAFILFVVAFLVLPSTTHAFPRHKLPKTEMTFEEAHQYAIMLDEWYDQLTDEDFPVIEDLNDVNGWAKEIVPYFSYEGITNTDYDGEYYGYSFPPRISFTYYEDDVAHLHIMGQTNCLSKEITLNKRMINPASPIYQQRGELEILVHELAHAQGICFGTKNWYNAEVSAQLAALEVLAAATNKGNHQTFGPLVETIRHMALASMWAISIDTNREDEFWSILPTIEDDPYELAYWNKSDRFWKSDPAKLEQILHDYNEVPLELMMRAMKNGYCSYIDISIDSNADLMYTPTRVEEACIAGVLLPRNWDVFYYPLVIDDLAYVFEHGDEFAAYKEA